MNSLLKVESPVYAAILKDVLQEKNYRFEEHVFSGLNEFLIYYEKPEEFYLLGIEFAKRLIEAFKS